MEGAGQLRGLGSNPRSKGQKLDAPVREGHIEPFTDWTQKRDPLMLHEFGDLPAGNRADAKAGLLGVQEGVQSGGQPGIGVNPPNPNVRVEDDHRL